VAVGVVLLVTVVYIAFCFVLYFRADDIQDDKLWSRLVYIARGLSALVATAFGWLFGREVHRAAAEHATKEADRARRLARSAHSKVVAGRALAKAVNAVPDSGPKAGGLAHETREVALAASHLAVLKSLAKDYCRTTTPLTRRLIRPKLATKGCRRVSARESADRGSRALAGHDVNAPDRTARTCRFETGARG
jgi:hypothetical protein